MDWGRVGMTTVSIETGGESLLSVAVISTSMSKGRGSESVVRGVGSVGVVSSGRGGARVLGELGR